MNHLNRVTLHPELFPTREEYPFNLAQFQQTSAVEFRAGVTLFVGENGTGKSTLLEAVANRCRIHIWRAEERTRAQSNPHEKMLYRCIRPEWANGPVPGSFFAGQLFQHFAELLDDMAAHDPGQLKYFGGKSLITQSHGQSLMSYFRSRYKIPGLYLLDEPETALSPARQVEMVNILHAMAAAGHAQFIVATHSPILLACPDAEILSFDHVPLQRIEYEQSQHYQLYKSFLADPAAFLDGCERSPGGAEAP